MVATSAWWMRCVNQPRDASEVCHTTGGPRNEARPKVPETMKVTEIFRPSRFVGLPLVPTTLGVVVDQCRSGPVLRWLEESCSYRSVIDDEFVTVEQCPPNVLECFIDFVLASLDYFIDCF